MSQVLLIWTLFLLSQTLSSINFSESDVYNALTSLESNKATGIDGIGPNILKVCAPLLYNLKPSYFSGTLNLVILCKQEFSVFLF